MPGNAPRNRASHEKIIDAAVGEFFTEEAQYQIVSGTVAQDALLNQGASAEGTAAHSMKSGWVSETDDMAVWLRDNKVAREMAQTRLLILAGRDREARMMFGGLTHTIQDEYPHAHTAGADGRRPLPWNPANPGAVLAHARSDSNERMDATNVRAAIAATLSCFQQLESAVLGLSTGPTGAMNPDPVKYDAFLKFRGIAINSKDQRNSYLKFDQERWAATKSRK